MGTSKAGGKQPRWIVWMFWPIMIAIASVLPLVIVLVSFTVGGLMPSPSGLWTAYEGMGGWAAPLYEDALSTTAIVATVLVAVAAATGFAGDWKALGARARTTLAATLTISLVTLGGIAAFAVPVVLNDPGKLPRAVVVLLGGWVTALVGMSILEISTPQQQLRSRRANWHRRRDRALRAGITVKEHVTRRQAIVAEVFFWLLPTAFWYFIGLATLAPVLDRPLSTLDFTFVLAVYYGNAIVAFAWRATADLSASAAFRRGLAITAGTAGAMLSLGFGLTLVSTSAAFGTGWALIAVTLAQICVLFIPFIARRVAPLRVIRVGATVRSLRSARKAYRAARRAKRAVATSPGMGKPAARLDK